MTTTKASTESEDRSEEPAGRTILAPVVSVEDAERILSTLAWFSRSLGRGVEYVTVIDSGSDRIEVLTNLAGVADRLSKLTREEVSCRVIVNDEPAEVFMEIARDRLVCMPTSATPFKRRHFVESYAAALLSQTTQPVILVGPQAAVTPHVKFDDIVIALAGDEECLDVLPAGRRLADDTGLDVRLVHVLEDHDDHVLVDPDGRARLWFPDSLHTSLNVELLHREPGTAERLASASQHSLLMMSTHARCGLERIAEGSIAFDTIANAKAPVVVVGPKIAPEKTAKPILESDRSVFRFSPSTERIGDLDFSDVGGKAMPNELIYEADPQVPSIDARSVVVLDGSERAAEAIGPGFALASERSRDFVAVGIAADGETASTRADIQEQLAVRGCADTPLRMLTLSTMETSLVEMANNGDIVVVSAFGTWTKSTRLYRLLGSLIMANAPAVVGIGPQVASQWTSESGGPLVVCVDESTAVDETIENLHRFIGPNTTEVVLLHIDDACGRGRRAPVEWDDLFDWTDIATQVEEIHGVRTRTETIASDKTTTAITTFAASIDASMIVMASYHRPEAGHATVASTSLSVVAYAPCPVGVLCGIGDPDSA